MINSEKIDKIWPIKEIMYSNTENCRYLRINSTCVNNYNSENGHINSCSEYSCPIRVL